MNCLHWCSLCVSRDERCGHCGPALIDAIKEQEISARVRKCSHVGGHIYAGLPIHHLLSEGLFPVSHHMFATFWWGAVVWQAQHREVGVLASGHVACELRM
eukprot:5883559-Amphidinium_carterae.1